MNARLALLLCVCTSACAEPVPLPPVVDNTGAPAATAPAVKPPSTHTLFEMMGRLEQLQQEVQQLTGKVEEQAYQLAELKKRQNSMYTDFDDRIQNLDTKMQATKAPDAAPAAPDAAAAAPDTPPAAAEPAAKPAEPAPAASPAPAPAAAKPAAAAAPAQTAVADSPEKQSYQHAYDELRNGRTTQSITEFNAFLTANPDSSLAGNAQYWLGEAYKVNRDNDAARAAFNKVIDKYPTSAKVPDAILKLGYMEIEQKNIAKAREYLNRVTKDFPDSTAGHLAAKKLQSLDEVKN